MKFFGEPWPSGVCDEGTRVMTPQGGTCILCSEAFASDDQGWFYADGSPTHRECSLRSTIGGIEHLTAGPHAVGSCYEAAPSRTARAHSKRGPGFMKNGETDGAPVR